jgi:VWFA-related protein
MRRSSCVFSAILLCLAVVRSAPQSPAPQPQATPDEIPPVLGSLQIPSATDEGAGSRIFLDVVVTDKSGKPVTGLEAKDFTLLDNGQPGKILSFQAFDAAAALPDPPVEVILFVDNINMSPNQVSLAQEEVKKFLLQTGGQLAQPVSIYQFNQDGLSVTPQASTDGNALAAELPQKSQLRPIWHDPAENELNSNSSLAVDSAVRFPTTYPAENGMNSDPEFRSLGDPSFNVRSKNPSIQNKLSLDVLGSIAIEERWNPGRKLLLWIGKGWPVTQNGDSFDWITEFSTRLREARIELSSVTFGANGKQELDDRDSVKAVGSARQAKSANLALQVLATQSGGRVMDTDRDLVSQIESCIADASAFYTISFDPPKAKQPDEYHDLKIQVNPSEWLARTNTGYYDEPTYYDQPNLAPEGVSVQQLELLLAKGGPDEKMARRLYAMELTERMSSTRLASWKTRLPGAKAWNALVALADASAFLDRPAAEIPPIAKPGLDEQNAILSRTTDYLNDALPRLPNFFATRTTVHYGEPPFRNDATWKTDTADHSLHPADSVRATIFYRDGAEVVDEEVRTGKKPNGREMTLSTTGIFGPMQSVVFLDAIRGNLQWSLWEQDAGGPKAVFRYVVPQKESHYEVSYCCSLEGDGANLFRRTAGYHGEITIDPASGAILRLTAVSDLEPNLPLRVSRIMLEYGPVEIGGTTYICPLRSVAILKGRTSLGVHQWGESFKTYGPSHTAVNDVSFADYHLFRSEVRVLPDDNPAPQP